MQKKSKIEQRHHAISELINSHAIENQHQLINLLDKKYGIKTNQSIVSRDLLQLSVVRQHYQDKIIYEMPTKSATREILRLGVQSITHNETTIVINTLPGLAPFIGDYLDQKGNRDILGTMAGENIVIAIPTSVQRVRATYLDLCKTLFYKPEKTNEQSPAKKIEKNTEKQ